MLITIIILSMNTKYKEAYEKSALAIREFKVAQAVYRSLAIGNDEFLASKAKYNTAMAEYDAAYAEATNV